MKFPKRLYAAFENDEPGDGAPFVICEEKLNTLAKDAGRRRKVAVYELITVGELHTTAQVKWDK